MDFDKVKATLANSKKNNGRVGSSEAKNQVHLWCIRHLVLVVGGINFERVINAIFIFLCYRIN